MNKVLVLGGSYFIGKKLVEVLIENKYSVFILNRGSKKNVELGVHSIISDRNEPQQMKNALTGKTFDIVIDVSGLNANQCELLGNCLDMTKTRIFVFLSSSAVYDVENLTPPYKETDTLKQNIYWTSYGQNKINAENYYTELFAKTQTKLIILRPPYVYGENNYAQRESFIFDHLCNNKPVIVPGSNNLLQFISAEDLAKTILSLLNHPEKAAVSLYNVGNTQSITFKEWVQCCAKAANIDATIMEYDHNCFNRSIRDFFPFFDYDNVLEVSKIKSRYSNETDFIQGLKSAFKWYLQNKDTIEFKAKVAENEKLILSEIAETSENTICNL